MLIVYKHGNICIAGLNRRAGYVTAPRPSLLPVAKSSFRTVLTLFSINYFSWPQGKYCIYKKGAGCPSGLHAGFVYWDDENIDNKNHFNGDLPEGEYTDKTKISFCCSTTGKAESEIVLPTEKPFYLFPYGDTTCQKVGMWFSEGFCR